MFENYTLCGNQQPSFLLRKKVQRLTFNIVLINVTINMKTKFNKDSRNLMIAILLGDGSISSTHGFRMTHCSAQKEYLQWKIDRLNAYGIKNCGLKSYISTQGYKVGEEYFYTRLAVVPFIKVLRRVLYKKHKQIANRKILNRLTPEGIAIWYMDDGHINHRKDVGIYVRIATCLPKEECQVLIDYFKEVWDINFYTFSEGKNTYSLCCGTAQAIKFIDLVKPYVLQIPCMASKVTYNISGRTRSVGSSDSKWKTLALQKQDEDIVCSASKDVAVNNGIELTPLSEQ